MTPFLKKYRRLLGVFMLVVAMLNLVSCMVMRDTNLQSDWMPAQFDVSDWGGFTGYRITLEKGKFVYRVLDGNRVKTKILDYPEEDQWNEFWRKLNNIGLWNWRREYCIADPAIVIDDGGKWVVTIEHGKHAITSTGQNAYPNAQNAAKSNQIPMKSKPYLEYEAALKNLFQIKDLYEQ